MSTLRYFLLFRTLLLSLLVGTFALPAFADDDGQADAGTEDLIQHGIMLRRSGQDEAALAVFLEAEKRSPRSVRVLLHVTTAAQATGRWLLADEYLQKASAFRSDPYYQRHESAIKSVEEAVAQHVGSLRVEGSPAGAEVFLNARSIGKLPLAEAKVLEVGSYELEVKANGYFPLRRPVTITSGLSREAVMLGANREDARSAGPAEPAVTPSQSHAQTSAAPLKARWITWTLAGTSAALLATSVASFVVRGNQGNHWNDDTRCLDASNPGMSREELCGDVKDKAERAERIGIVTGVVGLGFGAAAIAHFAWSGGALKPERRAAAQAPHCAIGLGNVVCGGTF